MKEMLLSAARECGISIDDDMAVRMETYWNYLKQVNESMNLTRVSSDEEAVNRHFIDSLIPLKLNLIPSGAQVLDLGSGAGFPGLPLAIARTDIRMVLMDSLTKRVNFLTDAAQRAGASATVTAIHARAEEAARGDMREAFDIVTARAVARMNVLCELALPFIRVGGALIAYKGAAAQEELDEARTAIRRLGGGNATLLPAGIPGRDEYIIVVKKLSPTPKSFPRKPGEATRKPL